MSLIVDKPFRKLVALNCDFEAQTPYLGYYTGQKWGANFDVDTGSVPETVWAVGGDWIPDTGVNGKFDWLMKVDD